MNLSIENLSAVKYQLEETMRKKDEKFDKDSKGFVAEINHLKNQINSLQLRVGNKIRQLGDLNDEALLKGREIEKLEKSNKDLEL